MHSVAPVFLALSASFFFLSLFSPVTGVRPVEAPTDHPAEVVLPKEASPAVNPSDPSTLLAAAPDDIQAGAEALMEVEAGGEILAEEAEISVAAKVFPALCDEEIVEEECQVMDVIDTPGMVSINELSFVMSASRPSLLTFLGAIGFQVGQPGDAEEFPCEVLCKAVVKSIPKRSLPPFSDVGCRRGFEGEAEVVCDIDLSPAELEHLEIDADVAMGVHEKPVLEVDVATVQEKVMEEGTGAQKVGLAIQHKYTRNKETKKLLNDVPIDLLRSRLANRFRIYPHIKVEVSESVGKVDIVPPEGMNESLLETVSAAGTTWTCSYKDCSHIYHCYDLPTLCSGCEACKEANAQGPHHTQTTTKRPTSTEAWIVDVEKVSVKAQAYVAHALQMAPKASKYLKKWFGNDKAVTIAEVNRVLNSLSGMLGNVAYEKGPECEKTTYAYVYPHGDWATNDRGQFVFYLCPMYFNAKEAVKIETLTHEGSHHAVAYTDDECMDNYDTCRGIAYGRRNCMSLAKKYPDRALRNADSHCFFINDVYKYIKHVMETGPLEDEMVDERVEAETTTPTPADSRRRTRSGSRSSPSPSPPPPPPPSPSPTPPASEPSRRRRRTRSNSGSSSQEDKTSHSDEYYSYYNEYYSQ